PVTRILIHIHPDPRPAIVSTRFQVQLLSVSKYTPHLIHIIVLPTIRQMSIRTIKLAENHRYFVRIIRRSQMSKWLPFAIGLYEQLHVALSIVDSDRNAREPVLTKES
ncbi:hypothetical protein FocTR4_00006177, partial [Fusarium oxysporum f. sp. cubense]